jgi:hypothetical protein
MWWDAPLAPFICLFVMMLTMSVHVMSSARAINRSLPEDIFIESQCEPERDSISLLSTGGGVLK